MNTHKYPGYFITFEGPEGSGKSTQASILTHDLKEKGKDVLLTREPGGTRISDEIRKILLSNSYKEIRPITELLLFAAGRAQHVQEKIIPNLEKGKIVICDRYIDSTVAYQGYGRGYDLKTVGILNAISSCNLKPDLTLFLDIPIEEGLSRAMELHKEEVPGKGDRFETEEHNFHHRVKEAFFTLMRHEPDRIKYIEATGTIDLIQKNIRNITYECLRTKGILN